MRRRKVEQEVPPGDPPVKDGPSTSEEEASPSVEGMTKANKLKGVSKCSLTRVVTRIVCILALVAMTVAVVVGLVMFAIVFLDEFHDWKGYEKAQDISLPPHVMDLFHVFDGNKDGVLDPFEFAIVAEQLRTNEKVSRTVLEGHATSTWLWGEQNALPLANT